MIDYEQILEKVLAEIDSVNSVEKAKLNLGQGEVVTDDLPIYTAEQGQIEYWHAYGGLCELQNILREYDLGFGSKDYDKMKVGYDNKQHAATFTVDSTHYCKLEFTEHNAAPHFQIVRKFFDRLNRGRG